MLAVIKRIGLLFIILVSFQTLKAQIQSNCNATQVLQAYYDHDIKHLAVKRMFDLKSTNMDSITISERYQDTIRKGMAAIFNLTTLPERDSIFDKYCIHQAISNYLYTEIVVAVDKDYTWTQEWKNLKTITGISALDKLISRYGFAVTRFSSIATYAVLTTNQIINIKPLCDSLETFAGVLFAEPQAVYGDGDEIIYTKIGNNRFYDFTVAYGDCQSGCIAEHTFKFKVDNNCSVSYLGVFDKTSPGYALPKPINCNISTTSIRRPVAEESMRVYPNPTADHLLIESVQKGQIELFNLQGQQVLSADLNSKTMRIDLSNLSNGIYFLKTHVDKDVSVRKIIKN